MDYKISTLVKFNKRLIDNLPNKDTLSIKPIWWLSFFFLMGIFSACQPVQKGVLPTLTSETIQLSQTKVIPTNTIQTSVKATQTAQPTQDLTATRAIVKITKEAAQATAIALAPIHKELYDYNARPNYGHIGAVYEPVTLTVDGYHASSSTNKAGGLEVSDFLLAADITWDSEYAIAGCGYTFRSDSNKEAPNEYRVILSRVSGGHIYFYTMAKGKIANFRDFYAIPYDPKFKWESGSTNRLTLGVKGNKVYIFSNKSLVGALDITEPPPDSPVLPKKPIKPSPPSKDLTGNDLKEAQHVYKLEMEEYEKAIKKYNEEATKIMNEYKAILAAYNSNDTVYDKGTVGMLAYSSAGMVNCQFSNAWLWVLDQE